MIAFVKGHGTENDFVLLPDAERRIDLTPQLVRRLCDRRTGVGADGVLRVVLAAADPEGAPMSDRARWFMDYRNADGSVAEMCGNGIRVFARYLVDEGLEAGPDLHIATRAGLRLVRLRDDGLVSVDMGPARVTGERPLVTLADSPRSGPRTGVAVDVGNPHVVVFVDDLAQAGSLVRPPLVDPPRPGGVNVEFAVRRGPAHLAMRVHERGVGETRSCGTGACAVMAAAAAADAAPADTTYVIDVPGGRLQATAHQDATVTLTGPAVLVARGQVTLTAETQVPLVAHA